MTSELKKEKLPMNIVVLNTVKQFMIMFVIDY